MITTKSIKLWIMVVIILIYGYILTAHADDELVFSDNVTPYAAEITPGKWTFCLDSNWYEYRGKTFKTLGELIVYAVKVDVTDKYKEE